MRAKWPSSVIMPRHIRTAGKGPDGKSAGPPCSLCRGRQDPRPAPFGEGSIVRTRPNRAWSSAREGSGVSASSASASGSASSLGRAHIRRAIRSAHATCGTADMVTASSRWNSCPLDWCARRNRSSRSRRAATTRGRAPERFPPSAPRTRPGRPSRRRTGPASQAPSPDAAPGSARPSTGRTSRAAPAELLPELLQCRGLMPASRDPPEPSALTRKTSRGFRHHVAARHPKTSPITLSISPISPPSALNCRSLR